MTHRVQEIPRPALPPEADDPAERAARLALYAARVAVVAREARRLRRRKVELVPGEYRTARDRVTWWLGRISADDGDRIVADVLDGTVLPTDPAAPAASISGRDGR